MKVIISKDGILPDGEYDLTNSEKLQNARANLQFSGTDRQTLIEYDRIAGQIKRDGSVLAPQSLWKLEEESFRKPIKEWQIRQHTMPKNRDGEKSKKFYPRGYTNSELENLVDKYGDLNVDKFNIGPSYFSKAALGLTELERRNSSKLGWWSFGVGVLALIFSGVAIWFTLKNINEDDQWRADEIRLLEEISHKLN